MHRDVRTSQGTFVSRHDDPDGVLAWVEEKVAQLIGIPSGHGEARFSVTFGQFMSGDAHGSLLWDCVRAWCGYPHLPVVLPPIPVGPVAVQQQCSRMLIHPEAVSRLPF